MVLIVSSLLLTQPMIRTLGACKIAGMSMPEEVMMCINSSITAFLFLPENYLHPSDAS
jgi:hypothetical protein